MKIFIITIVIILNSLKCISQINGIDTISTYHNETYKIKSNLIPDSVFKMKNLKSLSILGMDCDYVTTDKNGKDITNCWMIREIPKDIKELKKLEYLYLTVHAITEIPNEIIKLKNLKVISFTDNPGLRNIDNLTKVKNLEELYLFGCNMEKFPIDFGNLIHLKKLGLAGNNFNETEKSRIKKALKDCDITF